jgi:hypothetical protein
MFDIKHINGTPNGREIIFIGPYVGSWGHLFHFHIPITNRLKEQHPDAYIVSAGYVGDDYYYQNEKGESTIDGYIAIPTDPKLRRVYGLNQAPYQEEIIQTDELCELHFGKITQNFKMPAQDNQWFGFISQMPRTHYRLGLFAEPCQEEEPYVILHSKNAVGLADRDPRGEQIANADYELDKEYVKLLSEHIQVYIFGIPEECNEFEGDNVHNMVSLPADFRPVALLSMAERCEALISTSSASTLNYAISVACPSICFACRRYIDNHTTKWNWFETPTNHHVLFPFDAQQRVDETLKFLEWKNTQPRYTKEIIRVDENMGAAL